MQTSGTDGVAEQNFYPSLVLDSGEPEGNKDYDTDHLLNSNFIADPDWPYHLTDLITQ